MKLHIIGYLDSFSSTERIESSGLHDIKMRIGDDEAVYLLEKIARNITDFAPYDIEIPQSTVDALAAFMMFMTKKSPIATKNLRVSAL